LWSAGRRAGFGDLLPLDRVLPAGLDHSGSTRWDRDYGLVVSIRGPVSATPPLASWGLVEPADRAACGTAIFDAYAWANRDAGLALARRCGQNRNRP
jgi:hypothetical protein